MPCPLMLSKVSCRWDNRRAPNGGCFKRHWTQSANTSMASSKPRLLKVCVDEVRVDVQRNAIERGIVEAGVVEVDVEVRVEVDVGVDVEDVDELDLCVRCWSMYSASLMMLLRCCSRLCGSSSQLELVVVPDGEVVVECVEVDVMKTGADVVEDVVEGVEEVDVDELDE
eukprot:3254503-Amphidinium_carterae.3